MSAEEREAANKSIYRRSDKRHASIQVTPGNNQAELARGLEKREAASRLLQVVRFGPTSRRERLGIRGGRHSGGR